MDKPKIPLDLLRKPGWLKIKRDSAQHYSCTASALQKGGLHTICTSGKCPNRSECWSRGTATFMIGGGVCTRACRFCATPYSGCPPMLDPAEPEKLANAVLEMQLRYVVLTSVDRDDLSDYGAEHWQKCIQAVRNALPLAKIEALIPDFNGNENCLNTVLKAQPDVVAHNLETVRRLTPAVRHRATYNQSLQVLHYCKQKGFITKSGIMVGLGETPEEVLQLMQDCKDIGVSTLTIGQYLQPTRKHYPVAEYVHPSQFAYYKEQGEALGLQHVESGPLVRSSYHADHQYHLAAKAQEQ